MIWAQASARQGLIQKSDQMSVQRHTYDVVLKVARDLLAESPEKSGVLLRLAARMAFENGDLAASQENARNALVTYEKALEIDPVDTMLLRRAVGAAREAGDTDKAREFYLRKTNALFGKISGPAKEIFREAGFGTKSHKTEDGMINVIIGKDGCNPTTAQEREAQRSELRSSEIIVYGESIEILSESGHPEIAEAVRRLEAESYRPL